MLLHDSCADLPLHFNACRYKVGDMGVKQAEPRLERKKHRRQSRKTVNQSIIEELDDLDDDDNLLDDSILRALRHESQ